MIGQMGLASIDGQLDSIESRNQLTKGWVASIGSDDVDEDD